MRLFSCDGDESAEEIADSLASSLGLDGKDGIAWDAFLVRLYERQRRDGERRRETDRDGERQTETTRDRQRQTETTRQRD